MSMEMRGKYQLVSKSNLSRKWIKTFCSAVCQIVVGISLGATVWVRVAMNSSSTLTSTVKRKVTNWKWSVWFIGYRMHFGPFRQRRKNAFRFGKKNSSADKYTWKEKGTHTIAVRSDNNMSTIALNLYISLYCTYIPIRPNHCDNYENHPIIAMSGAKEKETKPQLFAIKLAGCNFYTSHIFVDAFMFGHNLSVQLSSLSISGRFSTDINNDRFMSIKRRWKIFVISWHR